MTAPTTAPAPEELALQCFPDGALVEYDSIQANRVRPSCAATVAIQGAIAAAIRQHSAPLEAQIAELTKERDRARDQTKRSMDLTDQAQDAAEKWKARATQAEAALSAAKNCMELALRHTDHGGIIHAMKEGIRAIDAALQPKEPHHADR